MPFPAPKSAPAASAKSNHHAPPPHKKKKAGPQDNVAPAFPKPSGPASAPGSDLLGGSTLGGIVGGQPQVPAMGGGAGDEDL